jgi:hypothetical protein
VSHLVTVITEVGNTTERSIRPPVARSARHRRPTWRYRLLNEVPRTIEVVAVPTDRPGEPNGLYAFLIMFFFVLVPIAAIWWGVDHLVHLLAHL